MILSFGPLEMTLQQLLKSDRIRRVLQVRMLHMSVLGRASIMKLGNASG
jgi:hypothetical protein